MKLMKQINRKTVEGKPMYKYLFSIPPEFIKDLNWKGGEEFSCNVQGNKLVIEKGKSRRN